MCTAQESPSATAELLREGNHALAALRGDRRQWQTHAALGLCGKTREAIDALAEFDEPQAHFYRGVCHWIDGDDERACALLAQHPHNDHARNLLALIRKPRLDVLAQLPWTRSGGLDLLSSARHDPKFQVRNISFHSQDLPNAPYADIHTYYDPRTPPDFYICQMVEWHFIPPNIQQLPCPVFGHTGDYDLHIQALHPWLPLFDEWVVTEPTEWHDVRRLVSVPVTTFSKSFGVPVELPALPTGPRDHDLFLSGTVVHPYHPDKVNLLQQVLRIPDARLKVINGFHEYRDYHRNLARARVCVTYIRHPGALPTRALEALAMGCVVVVQTDNVLTLWVGEAEGVLTYDLAEGDLGTAIRRILADWPEFERRAARGARRIREEFALSRVASQYLRYLTYRAASPRRRRIPAAQPDQKRCVLQTGWLPCYEFGDSPILKQIHDANQDRLRRRIENERPHSRLFIDAIRESVLYHHHRAQYHAMPVAPWLTSLRALFRRGLEAAPRSLVLRFNFIRILFHYGDAGDALEAIRLSHETLSVPDDKWQLDILEDVFPWDFFASFLNYRAYLDRITQHLTEGTEVEAALKQLIRASLCYYTAYYDPDPEQHPRGVEQFRRAVELDPEFPYYRFHLARSLLERGLAEDEPVALDMLEDLASHSILFLEAYELLERHRGAALERLGPVIRKAREQIVFFESGTPAIDCGSPSWRGPWLAMPRANLTPWDTEGTVPAARRQRFAAETLRTQADADVCLVEDAGALYGRSRRSSATFRGCLSFGPYLSLPPGRYRADCSLRIDDVHSPGPVAYLEVTASRGRRLAFRELQPSDFGTAGRYVVLGLAFTSAQALNAVEFRVFTAGTRAVSLDYIDLLVRQEERTAVRRRHATRHK